MLDAHYKGDIDINNYWAIGDSRTESITAYAYGNHSQDSQDIELVIIGMSHDDLETPINEISKAAITVQTKNALKSKIEFNGASGVSQVIWKSSQLRAALSTGFYHALPTYIKERIKSVNKKTNIHAYYKTNYPNDARNSGQSTWSDNVFILSETEAFGSNYSTQTPEYGREYLKLPDDGMQYEYMKITANRIKCNGEWYLRTATIISGDSESMFMVKSDGSLNTAGSEYGAGRLYDYCVPAFCL